MSRKILFSRRMFLISGASCCVLSGNDPAQSATTRIPMLHQPGIMDPQQPFVYFLTFDLITEDRATLAKLLRRWTQAGDALMAGKTVPEMVDSREADGLSQRDLTLTIGLGPGVFSKDGKDRYGLEKRRPAALIDLPRFNGDQLVPEHTGGDICLQSCANDPQSAFHAARVLSRIAYGIAEPRWAQSGFLPNSGHGQTPRTLMGFKDGTMNPRGKTAEGFVWVHGADQPWMEGGSYLVARIIRIAIEHWDRTPTGFQEETMGRQKANGAPIGAKREFQPLTLRQTDHDGNPVTAQNAHARLGAPEENDGAQILRRAYSYENGLAVIAERWPPWHKGNEFDAGLLFICFQQDPRTGFVKIFDRMSKFDMLNQFVTHIGSGLFACPGRSRSGWIGQELFET